MWINILSRKKKIQIYNTLQRRKCTIMFVLVSIHHISSREIRLTDGQWAGLKMQKLFLVVMVIGLKHWNFEKLFSIHFFGKLWQGEVKKEVYRIEEYFFAFNFFLSCSLLLSVHLCCGSTSTLHLSLQAFKLYFLVGV